MGYAPIPLLEITLDGNLSVALVDDLHDVRKTIIRCVARLGFLAGSKFDVSEEILPVVGTP